MAILIISLVLPAACYYYYTQCGAYRSAERESERIFFSTQAARTNPIHLTRWPFWLMQLTVRRRTLCAWFGLYNVACFHLKHFMPGGGVYRRDCLVSTVRSTLHPASRRISARKTQTESSSSKNGTLCICCTASHERERRYGSGRPCNPQMNTLPPPATPVTHSASTKNFSLHFARLPGANKCCVPRGEVPAEKRQIAHASL